MKAAWHTRFKRTRPQLDGRSFASALEASVYCMLKAEGVLELRCQVEVRLSDAGIIYKPDFYYFDPKAERWEYAEAKGFETPEWRLKLKLFRAYGPAPLRIYKGSAARPKLVELVVPTR